MKPTPQIVKPLPPCHMLQARVSREFRHRVRKAVAETDTTMQRFMCEALRVAVEKVEGRLTARKGSAA